jgi:hypothetical protein
MPLPLVVPVILGSLAAGGGLTAWLLESDDEWADATVFNTRMSEIHMGILQLNELLAQCKPIHTSDNKSTLQSWRDFVKSWAGFYRDVGKLTFDPDSQTIAEGKRKAAQLQKWLDGYKALCGGKLPAGSMTLTLPDAKPKSDNSFWTMAIGGAIAAAGIYWLTRPPSYHFDVSNVTEK